jgi:type I restriction enzyme, S subunit
MKHPLVALAECCDFLDHIRRPVKESERVNGPYPYFGANGQQGWINDYLFDEPLVLLAEDGGHFSNPERGIAYKISGKTWVNNHAHVLRPRAGIIDINYLSHALKNKDVRRHLSGSTRDKLTKAGACQIEIPLPPLEEQRRIAAILDKTQRLATMCARLQATHRQVGESLFIDTFGDPRTNPLGLPSAMLGEIADCQLGKMLDKKRESGSSQRPYLRNANIRWFDVDVSDLLFMDIEDHEMDRFSVCAGDLLVCEGGEPGRAAIWRGDSGVFGFQKALHRIRPDKTRVLPEYLNWVLWILAQRGLLGDHITSATIAHLTREKLLKIRVLLPSLSAQELFSRELGALDSLGLMARSRSNLVRSLNSSLFSALVATGIS